MKKLIALVVCATLIFNICAMSISATNAAALTMPESTVRQGEEFTLPITLENNPGLISLRLSVTFGSNLELIGITNTERLNGWLQPDISKESPILFWKDSLAEQNNTESGVIANLIFKVKNNVAAKETVRVECLDSYRANGTQNSILAGETQLKITCANHSFGEWSKKDDNYHSKACKVCGTIETAEHTWDDGTVTKQPTPANSGEKVFTCTACGATKNEKIAPTTNIEKVQISAKKAVVEKTGGCYSDGYYQYSLESFEPEFTVTLKDGTVKTVSNYTFNDNFYWEFGFCYNVSSNQSAENEWGVGEHEFTVTIAEVDYPCKVTITEIPIKNVAIRAKKAVIEKTGGFNDGYYEYSFDSFMPEFTVTLKDGTVKTVSDGDEFYSEFGFRYDVSSNQSAENEWGIGEHEFTVTIAGVNYPCKVTITESPIKNVVVKAQKSVVEKTGGRYDHTWYGRIYYEYSFDSFEPEFTVTFKDGTVKTGSNMSYSVFGFKYDVSSNQSAENEWGVGDHEFTVTIAGVDYPCKVTITESPIENVVIKAQKAVIEKTNGYDKGEYYKYNLIYFKPEFTITLKDGTVKIISPTSYSFEDSSGMMFVYLEHDLPSCLVSSNQSAENEWGVGEHEFTVTIAGVDCPCKVTITESPIKNVAIRAKKAVIEKTGSYNDGYYEYSFDSFMPEFTVTFKDGTVKTGSYYGFYSKFGFEYDVSSNQSAENEWGIGEHEFTVTIAGVDYPCKVTITESPIKNVAIRAKKAVIEKTGDYYHGGYCYYDLDSFEPEFTVTLKDGTVKTASADEFYSEFGFRYSVSSNQSAENEWGVGEHEFTVTIAGVDYPCKVTITESPIENVVIKAQKAVIEKTGGYYHGGYYHYDLDSFDPEFTVTLKDGTVKIIPPNSYSFEDLSGIRHVDLDHNLPSCLVSSNQSAENEWGVGKHTFVVKIAGKDYNCSVLVVKNPIKTVKAKLKESTIQRNTIFDCNGLSFEVTFQNGEKSTFEGAGYSFLEEYGIAFGNYDTAAKGTFKTTVTFMGVTTDLWYTVVDGDGPYTNVTVSGNEEIIITLYKKDGTKEQQKVVSYLSHVGGLGGSGGYFLTDKGQTFWVRFSWFEEPDEPADYTRDYELRLSAGNFKVSSSSGQQWFQMYNLLKRIYLYSWYFKNGNNAFSFDGKVSEENVDAVLYIALQNLYATDKSNYFYVDLETAQSAVEKLFDLNGFDLTTAKSYNKEKGYFAINEREFGFLGEDFTLTYNAETGWTFIQPNGDGTVDSIICDQSGHIQKIAFGVQNIGHKHSFTTTENLDGRFHGSSCTECGRFEMAQHHFHGVMVSKAPSATENGTKIGFCEECGKNIEFDIYASEFENYDIVENGKLDLVDVAKLAQYVAGWYGDIPIDYDYNEDDEVNLKEVVLLTRLVLN